MTIELPDLQSSMPPPVAPPYWERVRRPVAAGLSVAVLAAAGGCTSQPALKVGGGPAGKNTAAPAQLVPEGSAAPADGTRPNIVTIVADDMRTDDLRWMPRIRELVEEQGLDFRNSFSSNPLCAPARSSLLSGQHSHNTGVVSVEPPRNYSTFDDRASVGTALNRAGYNTLFLGKYLNGYGNGRSRVTQKNSFRYVPPLISLSRGGWTQPYPSVQPRGTYRNQLTRVTRERPFPYPVR
jgi:N-acetylglucosamine-6-sulfatase